MDEEKIEIVDEDILGLAKRGDDKGVPFEEPWVSCHVQNCQIKLGRRSDGQAFYKCMPVEQGCERLGDVWCCCEMFRYNRGVPKEDRKWEHVPDGRSWKRYDEEWKYECFCVHTYPWDEDMMDCK